MKASNSLKSIKNPDLEVMWLWKCSKPGTGGYSSAFTILDVMKKNSIKAEFSKKLSGYCVENLEKSNFKMLKFMTLEV